MSRQAIQIRVDLAERGYDIVISSGGTPGVGAFARTCCRGSHSLVVTDENAAGHADAVGAALTTSGFQVTHEVLTAGEKTKSLAMATRLYDRLADEGADRSTLVVPVGGGVVGDLAGFVAATYSRGLPLLMVPTTLLAMVDSSVGGKVAVNHPRGKNLIGAFHQPVGVWIETNILSTLPDREYRSGLAEVVKYGVILDADFFLYLEENCAAILERDPDVLAVMIARCCRLKADVVQQDEREETGRRMVLNYGHTFAHAFEAVAGYGSWLHGEAVAAGMICASRLAERRGLIGSEITERQKAILGSFGLAFEPGPRALEEWLAAMRRDKKAQSGRLRFVLPRRLGEVDVFDDVTEADVRAVLEEAAS